MKRPDCRPVEYEMKPILGIQLCRSCRKCNRAHEINEFASVSSGTNPLQMSSQGFEIFLFLLLAGNMC